MGPLYSEIGDILSLDRAKQVKDDKEISSKIFIVTKQNSVVLGVSGLPGICCVEAVMGAPIFIDR